MTEELLVAFSKLSINDKRNEISSELMKIGEMLKLISAELHMETELSVKNYDSSVDGVAETDTLTFFYEDIYNIKREVMQIFNYISIKKKTEE